MNTLFRIEDVLVGKASELTHPLRHHWHLRPDLVFLNHGSFGATPRCVLEAQRQWIEALESDPIAFLAPERSLLPKLDQVRDELAKLLKTPSRNLAFVRNATDGVNAVVQSFPFRPNDEVIVTNHGYNACNNAVRYAAERAGATVRESTIPFPLTSSDEVLDAIEQQVTSRTKLLVVDHVTSPTGLVFPVAKVIVRMHERGIRVLVDGAHAAGMVNLDLDELQPDYYTSNHHKWLCGPKTSAFLYVKPEWQTEVRPTIISHGANRPDYGVSPFLAEFNWIGTYDPSPILALPAAFRFLSSLHQEGLVGLMTSNRSLAIAACDLLLERFEIAPPAPQEMLGSLAAIPLPRGTFSTSMTPRQLQMALYADFNIEVPVFPLHSECICLRVSAQAYNELDEYERLADAVVKLMRF